MACFSPTEPLTLPELAELLRSSEPVRLPPEAAHQIEAGYNYLRRQQAPPPPAGGSVFARLPDAGLPPEAQAQWQANLLMSHAAGALPEVPSHLVRRMLLLKVLQLSLGYHGVALPTVKRLLDFYNREVWPVVLEQGSLGAYGDQAPLAHLCLPLLGLGEVRYQGYRLAAADVLELLGWTPLPLEAQEGITLLSGNQFMLAYATEVQERALQLLRAANAIAALSADVLGEAPALRHAALLRARRHAGPQVMAAWLAVLLDNSELPNQPWAMGLASLAPAFGATAQTHGASHDALTHVGQVVEAECNALPGGNLVFPADDVLLPGGGLPGQPLPLALDILALAVAGLGGVSVRRTGCLLGGHRGLPPALVAEPALHFGLLALPQTATSLESQCRQLCAPASLIESGGNPYGPLSAGSTSAIKARRVVENVEQILGIELLAAVQALDFRRPARSSSTLETVAAAFRERVTFVAHDRVLAPDLEAAARFVREYAWPMH